jgi:ubiquinone/menaquinone biosynthesis C-methylase UbiE
VLRALAPHVRFVVGSDISEGMLQQACTTAAPNVAVVRTSGRDLKAFRDASFDCVLAVDSFPYLVLSGSDLARAHLAEFARVLSPAGTVAIFNYSYRGDLDSDVRDLSAFAADYGLSVGQSGERPFAHWDGAAFILRAGGRIGEQLCPGGGVEARKVSS